MNPKLPQQTWERWLDGWLGQLVLAVLLSLIYFGIRLGLDPILGDRQPFAPAYAVVALAAWLAGWRCSLGTIASCALLGSYFFVEPRGSLKMGPSDFVSVNTFVLVSLIIVHLGNVARNANRALREADGVKDHFIATLSHELRNPLAPVVNGIMLLRQNRSLDDEAISAVDMIERQVRHMTRLMDDLLDLSRITRGRLELRREAIDLRGCIAQAVELAQPRNGSARDIKIRVADGLPPLFADPTRVTQVIGNLLHNAVKFSPPHTPIRVDARCVGNDVLISVSDEGPGIASSLLPDLFSPFNKPIDPADPVSGGSGGLGIGLWLANRLAQLHGGRIEVIRPPSGGVEMVVRLPAKR